MGVLKVRFDLLRLLKAIQVIVHFYLINMLDFFGGGTEFSHLKHDTFLLPSSGLHFTCRLHNSTLATAIS